MVGRPYTVKVEIKDIMEIKDTITSVESCNIYTTVVISVSLMP